LAGAWYHRPEAALTGNIEISNNVGTTGGHNNDYEKSGLPGWDVGVGCVFLGTGSTGNLIDEAGDFVPGTGGASKQVVDYGTNNRVIGHPANNVSDPGIGQRMKDLRALFAQMDVLQEDEQ
jgi:hypothetical protein